jgi:16S rRNA (cytosine967-C5)-methyltransferase
VNRGPITPRTVARAVLDRVDKQGAWATPALDGELARAGLDERDRRLAAEIVYGVLRHRTRLDRAIAEHAELKKTPPRVVTALRVAAYQLLFLDRVPPYAAVDDAVAAARDASGPKLGGFVNAVLRKVVAKREPPLPADPRARLEVEYSLPRWILDELDAAGGLAHAPAFAEAAPIIARGNRRKTTRDTLIEHFAAAGVTASPLDIDGHTPMALRLEGLGDPARSPSFLAGLWTVQDAGAQVVAEIAAPRAGQRILDACAGVGGKSTHLAELADDTAVIDAADLNATKLGLCAETASRLGLTSIKRHAVDLLGSALPGPYDLIVLDVPCTGLGVLRRHPDAKWRLQPADVARMAALQRQLLDAVVKRLAPGGTLVYSVCTFTRAEGPEQISGLVARTGMRIVGEHRTWPPDADAFYLARLSAPG